MSLTPPWSEAITDIQKRLGTTGYTKFGRALKTQVRPVSPPLQQLPFRDFSAEEFLGRTLTTCRGPGGCVSVCKSSTLTFGQLADACVYFGGEAAGATQAKPGRQKARPGAAHKTFPVALCLPIPTWSRARKLGRLDPQVARCAP
jgi:hypothetical protein